MPNGIQKNQRRKRKNDLSNFIGPAVHLKEKGDRSADWSSDDAQNVSALEKTHRNNRADGNCVGETFSKQNTMHFGRVEDSQQNLMDECPEDGDQTREVPARQFTEKQTILVQDQYKSHRSSEDQ